MVGGVMTVLCLVELDAGAPADASLRALTLARSLGDPAIRAVVFAAAEDLRGAALADYGVSEVYVVEPAAVDGYAPQAWARVLAGLAEETGATRCWPTSARSPGCRWPRTAPS